MLKSRDYQCVGILDAGSYWKAPRYDVRGIVTVTVKDQVWISLASSYALYFPIAGSEQYA